MKWLERLIARRVYRTSADLPLQKSPRRLWIVRSPTIGESIEPLALSPDIASIDFGALFRASPNPYVVLDRSFAIVAMNAAYLAATGRTEAELSGRNMFDAFPSDPQSDSYQQLRTSLEDVLRTGEPDQLALIRYDIPLAEGGIEERYWSATHTPLKSSDGQTQYILQHTVDVTELHRLRGLVQSADGSPADGGVDILTDVFHRATAVHERNQVLAEEGRQLRSLFEQAPGFIALLTGPEHRFQIANEAYRQLVGHRDILGKRVREALPEVVEQGFVTLLDEVSASGKPFVGRNVSVELQVAPGGASEERVVDFVYQPISSPDGTVLGILVQGHDVTDHKRAVDALSESEQRFRLIAERAPVMLWMSDTSGKCAYLNTAQREFWGLSTDEVASFEWGATVHPDDRDALFGPYADAMAGQTSFTVEARFRRADGAYRRFHTHAEPRLAADGKFLGMIGVNVDITDVREAEERYRRIFEQASDLILTADLDQVITDCNPAAAKAVGLSRSEAIGRRISDFVSPEDYARTSEMLHAKIKDGGTTQYDVRVRGGSGDTLFWEVNSGLTFDDASNPVGLHVVARDVSERKRFEKHQQLLVGELNHRVKNTLAIVQSLAHQSFRADASPADAIRRFEGRLEALAAAHNLLTRKNWEAASVQEVVADATAPFCSEGRCEISGPDVLLPPQTAVSLALAIHELATNASKYGALSAGSGRVSISWEVNDGTFSFLWTERGGPPVAKPERRGFGTRMIERTLVAEFRGTVDLDFAPSGVTCRVTAPIPDVF